MIGDYDKILKCAAMMVAVVFSLSGCSDNEITSDEVMPMDVDMFVLHRLMGAEADGTSGQLVMAIAYNESDMDMWDEKLYLSLEQNAGEELKLARGENKYSSTICNKSDDEFFYAPFQRYEWDSEFSGNVKYDYYTLFSLVIPDEGEYEFALKLFFPDSGKLYLTSEYRLSVSANYGLSGGTYYSADLERID